MITAMKDRILSANNTAPRYTSYPPATAFQPGFSAETYGEWLAALPVAPASIYCHIPFCQRLCYYCGCHTTICNDPSRLSPYAHALQAEMESAARHIGRALPVSHIHFGGGSPTILPPGVFSTLMQGIRERFDVAPNADIAVEADPRQFSEALIATYAKNGVTRVSLGVQDFDERVLAAVNRPQPFYLSWDAVGLCRAYGIESINLDLMYGLPGQTVESLEQTIHQALSLKPDRIAFFGYAHVPWMKKHMRMMGGLELPDASLRYDLYAAGSRILQDHGYLPVGIDHFVRPTDSMARALGNRTLRRNFQGYTTDTAETLIGFGASAIGKLPRGFVQNTPDLRIYQDTALSGGLPVHRGYVLNVMDTLYAEIISELMCYMAVDLQETRRSHNLPDDFFTAALDRAKPMLDDGLISMDGHFLRVHHPHIARVVAACFDPMTEPGAMTGRHSSAV